MHNIERWHRTIKERSRCYYAMIPFKYLPRRMAVELMTAAGFYVNAFAWKYGVSDALPLLTIAEGYVLDFHLHFQAIFGEFCQAHEGTDNAMALQTIDAAAVSPNGNLQGGMCCFSLDTGKILQRASKDIKTHK